VANVPRVVAFGRRLVTVDGIDVHLLTVESWGDRVVVRAVGAATAETARQNAEYDAAMTEWFRRRGAGGDDDPPRSPGERIHDGLEIRIEDDDSTALFLIGARSGGSGTELLGEWIFEAAEPPAAHLTLTVAAAGGVEATVDVDFAEPASARL
jgi:hypothetical protein